MLEYNHAFNTEDLTQPFHVHQILSDTTEVKIYLNSQFIGEFKPNGLAPNTAQGRTYYKYLDLSDLDIFNLLVSGSEASYPDKIESSIFNNDSIVYIKNLLGATLYKNPDTGLYSWSTTKRSRFFFNPYYFDSKFLWGLKFGNLPTGVTCQDQWPELEETLFITSTFKIDLTWLGEQPITMVEPMVVDYYNRDTEGYVSEFTIDEHLDIPHVIDGDHLLITNGRETIEFDVKNSGGVIFDYATSTYTNRPMVHVPIQLTNPNKLYHFTKGMESLTQEIIHKTLEGIDIQFEIVRT